MIKRLWNSLIVAFSMYSKIPMPRADWNKENMKYSLCFFPCVGMSIGLAEWGIFKLMTWLGFGILFKAAIMVVIPIIISGGIHVDGLLDTADALSSWRERERRLEILKDSHAGAFAVIIGIGYFVAAFGTACEIRAAFVPVAALAFTVSRIFSALAVNNFPNANPKGTAAIFKKNALKKQVNVTMILMLAGVSVIGAMLSPILYVLMLAAAVVSFLYYRYMSNKYFGGITGDLAGYFVCVSELAMVMTVVVAFRIMEVVG